MLIQGRYELQHRIGDGAFGVVYKGYDTQEKRPVAIKAENSYCSHPQLYYEYRIYRALEKTNRFPKVYHFVENYEIQGVKYNLMVMQLFDSSLEDLFKRCKKRFSLKTVVQLGIQMLECLEALHDAGLLHRDLKPDNFMLDRASRKINMIDFGLAKKYRDQSTHIHVPYSDHRGLTGTPRYASINNHLGIRVSRRDDLESLDYILMYFLRGSLPWQGARGKTKKHKYQKIMEKKLATSIDELHNGYPSEFRRLGEYARCLRYADKPDYGAFIKMFKDLAHRYEIDLDGVYDWDILDASPILETMLETPKEENESEQPAVPLEEGEQN